MSAEHKAGAVFALPAGQREMLTKARAIELVKPLADLVDSKTPVDKIVLSGKSFDEESAQVFGEVIGKVVGLRVADFSDVIAGRKKEVGLAALQALCAGLKDQKGLEEVVLSDNALGAEGVKACANAVGQNVRRIYFNNNGLQGEAAGAIVELVFRGGKTSDLETFEIFNNLLKDAGAKALAPLFQGSPKLRHLRFATTRLSPKGGLLLANSLVDLRGLTHLDLSDNTLGEDAGQVLAKMLSEQKALRVLNLGDTGIGKPGVAAVCRAVEVAPLEVLELHNLEMDRQAAAMHVAPLVAKKGKLLKLNLEGNEIRARGALAVLAALEANTHLQELNLAHNSIGSSLKKGKGKHKGKKGKGNKAEGKEEIGDVATALIGVLKNKPHLRPKAVRVNENRLTKADLAAVASALKAAGKHDALHVPEDGDEDEHESGSDSGDSEGEGGSDMDEEEDHAKAKDKGKASGPASALKQAAQDEVDALAKDLTAKAKPEDTQMDTADSPVRHDPLRDFDPMVLGTPRSPQGLD